VHAQIIAYGGRDDRLFNQAIAQSGTPVTPYPLPNSTDFQAAFDAIVRNTDCAAYANASAAAQLACVRELPIDVFRENSVGPTHILFDGDFIDTSTALDAYRAGRWVKVAAFMVRHHGLAVSSISHAL
jgi:hypothetical protein